MAQYIKSAESLGASTTTSTSPSTKLSVTLTAGEQTASAVYYIFAYGEVDAAVAGTKVVLKLVNTTGSVTYQDLAAPPARSTYANNICQRMMGIFTAAGSPADNTFEIQFATGTAAAEVQVKNAHIVIYKKEADDFHAESLAKTDATTTYATKATATQTVAGRYLCFAVFEAVCSAGDRPYIRMQVDGSTAIAAELLDTPSASSRQSMSLSWVSDDWSSASHSVAVQLRDQSSFSDIYNARVICIQATSLPAYWYSQTATDDTSLSTSFEQAAAVTQSFASVAHWVIATTPARTNSTVTPDIVTTIRKGGTEQRTGKTVPRQLFGVELSDSMGQEMLFEGDGSSQTVESGCYLSSSASGNRPGANLIVVQLESAGVSGTASITEAADTASATGTVRIAGAASITEAADTSSGTAVILLQATAAITEAGDTLAATGALAGAISGTASIAEASDTVSSAGTVLIAGTASIAEAGDTAASTGTIRIAAAASIAEASDTASATGTVGLSAATTIAEASDTATSAGTLRIAGSVAITEASDTSAATGKVAIAGTCTITEAGDTCAATGTFGSVIAGTASIAEANDTVSASGTVRIAASVAIAEASDTSAATGRLALLGTATITEAADTVSAAGTILAIGGLDLPAGTYAFRWTHGERSMAWTHGERGFDWTHGERSFRHVDG